MAKQTASEKRKRERERRQDVRMKLDLLVAYGTAFDLHTTAYMHDIGHGGVFIHTENPLEVGACLELEFTLPETFKTIHAKAKVTWSRKENEGDLFPEGMGLTFLDIDPADQKLLRVYVSDLVQKEKQKK